MKWSKQKPSEPGYYWVTRDLESALNGREHDQWIVQVHRDANDRLWVQHIGHDGMWHVNKYFEPDTDWEAVRPVE